MKSFFWPIIQRASLVLLVLVCSGAYEPADAESPSGRVDAALQNIDALVRPGRIGYATIWDGNKYIQCRRTTERALRCEAAGLTLQPSLKSVLTLERVKKLEALGWKLDPAFGNYVRTFPAKIAVSRIADDISKALTDVYGANVTDLEFQTRWIADIPCPPRNGPSQNLAGIVNDAPSMLPTALLTCSYAPEKALQRAASAKELVDIYSARTAAEIQRLRVNAARKVFVIFSAGIGYVQCMPNASPSELYCEAQSAESWPALTSVLTPERVSVLHNAGFADPGRAPNYSKTYSFEKFSDIKIATEILSLLYTAYGYTGATALDITTE